MLFYKSTYFTHPNQTFLKQENRILKTKTSIIVDIIHIFNYLNINTKHIFDILHLLIKIHLSLYINTLQIVNKKYIKNIKINDFIYT